LKRYYLKALFRVIKRGLPLGTINTQRLIHLVQIGKPLNTDYKPNPRYLANPSDHIFQDNDVEISDRPEIEELHDHAFWLSNKIEGEFDLDYLTFQIRYNQLAFVHTGLIAAQIKFKKLYKETHSNFDQYCRDELGLSYWQIDDTIKATDVVMELIANGFDVLPKMSIKRRN
jgi:hypothetical protein